MSVCTFIAADIPLPEVKPPNEYPLEINVDSKEIFDGGADDNFFLHEFYDTEIYTDKKYGVFLEWNYTEGRAKCIIEYIKNLLTKTNSVEMWHIWLEDYWEFEDRPFVHRKTVSKDFLTPTHIKELDDAEIWNKPDKFYPERPSFYCLTVTK